MPTHKSATPPTMMTTGAEDKDDGGDQRRESGEPFVDLMAGPTLACRKAANNGVTWHTLRHTFASRVLAGGSDIVTVQQLLLHSTVTVTMRYMHTNLDSKRHAVAKLKSFGDVFVTPCSKMQRQKCSTVTNGWLHHSAPVSSVVIRKERRRR